MTTMLIPVYIIIFAFGAVIGSFCNVCIFRIPKHETVVTTPSHCMSCGYRLKWYDLIPIVSWLCLKGKCRKCGEKISPQYPLIETVNGLLYVLVFWANDFDLWESGLTCLLASALLVLSVIDFRTFEIPLEINGFILVLGLLHTCLHRDCWYNYVLGFLLVSGILELIVVLSKGRAMGGGDVKLMAAAGLFLGWKGILLAFAVGCVAGAVIHILRMKIWKAGRMLAFGPYLSIGIFVAALWADEIINRYIGALLG